MTSRNINNSSNLLPTKVEVKVEPGEPLPISLANIKIEEGVAPSTTRLTSFRVPRDLTLGGNIKRDKPKKQYTPNLNVQRNKKKEDDSSTVNVISKKEIQERGRGRGRDRGRGASSTRGTNNLIQSKGIFSEISVSRISNRSSGGSYSRESSSSRESKIVLEKPKLDLNRKIDKAEEEKKLKLLLRDDFIDDLEEQLMDNVPIKLPVEKKVEYRVKNEKEENGFLGNKIKNELVIKQENGEGGENELKIDTLTDDIEIYPDNIPQIVKETSNSYFLIRFPDCLPGLPPNSDDSSDRKSKPSPSSDSESGSISEPEHCELKYLKTGLLGKLQFCKSGKVKLILGDSKLNVFVGQDPCSHQDLLAAKLDSVNLNGDLIKLGSVDTSLICRPDWDSMLKNF